MRFGVIGIGNIGWTNVPALMSWPEAEIVAVANRTISKAVAFCEKLRLNCPVYADWREMITEEKLDAVLIQLYNDLHYECFMECAVKGIHILVEKPLANRYEECQKMVQTARKNGIRATVMLTQRYGAVLQTAKAYITAHREELGDLLCVNDQNGSNYFHKDRPAWHLDPVRSGGGIVLNYGVHQLDRIHWLMEQKTTRFHAQYLTRKPGVDTISSYVMMGVGDRGTPYTINCNGYTGPWINEIVLSFANGVVRCLVMDNPPLEKGVYVGNTETNRFEKIPACCIDGDGNHEMYRREMREALDYLTGITDEAPISLEWAAEMVRLCELGFTEK